LIVEISVIPILAVAIPTIGGFVVHTLRVEHRLTRLETKVDTVLEKNGIDPKKIAKEKNNV